MASTHQLLLFVIVGKNEPLYEGEFHKSGVSGSSDSVTRQNYFVLHSALDLVEKAAWTTNNMYLKVVDKVSERVRQTLKMNEEMSVRVDGCDSTCIRSNLKVSHNQHTSHR